MAYQYEAVTGRRRLPNYRAIIEAQLPYLTSLYAQREEDKFARRGQAQAELGLGREEELGRERLELGREQLTKKEEFNQEQLALLRSQRGLEEKQTVLGQGLQVGQLGLQGLMLHGLLKGTPPPSIVPVPGSEAMTGAYGTPLEGAAIDMPISEASRMPGLAPMPTQEMSVGGLKPPMATPGYAYSPTPQPYTFTPPPPSGLTPGIEEALFTEAGVGAVGAANVPTSAGLVPIAGETAGLTGATGTALEGAAINAPTMATSATATPATGGFGAAAGGVGVGTLGYPVGYYGAKMSGAKPSQLHGYGLAGTTVSASLAAAFFSPWSLLAIPLMMAIDPKATEETGKKWEEEIRRTGEQAERKAIRPVAKEAERTYEKITEEAKRPVKQVERAVRRIFKSCIIITACTNPNSYEVNVTRRYRDKIMHPTTLRGYYMLAEKVVPLIHKSDNFRKFLKKHLVDSLVDTLEWKLGEKTEKPKTKSRLITAAFLSSCRMLGLTKEQFIRCNGEVF